MPKTSRLLSLQHSSISASATIVCWIWLRTFRIKTLRGVTPPAGMRVTTLWADHQRCAPSLVLEFATARDKAEVSPLAAIQQEPPPHESPYALPVGAGGASLTSLARHATGSYLNAFFRVAGPQKQGLTTMGGKINRSMAQMLAISSAFRDL